MFTASVASNALTILTDFGTLIVPAGISLGASNSLPFRAWVTNNGGLAASICSIGGAITRPFRPLGSITFETGLPIAGQWTSAGLAAAWEPGDPLPGDYLFSQQWSFPEFRSPNPPVAGQWYDTGMSATITPQSACNSVAVSIGGCLLANSALDSAVVAIFRGGQQLSGAYAPMAWSASGGVDSSGESSFVDAPMSNGPVTYDVRVMSQTGHQVCYPYTSGSGGSGTLSLAEICA